jgi:hypothetical protein
VISAIRKKHFFFLNLLEHPALADDEQLFVVLGRLAILIEHVFEVLT